MTIDRNFEVVTFWETMRNEKYELKGRIKREEKDNFKTFLYNTDKEVSDDNIFVKKLKDLSIYLEYRLFFFSNKEISRKLRP
jgi:hypothetical protein